MESVRRIQVRRDGNDDYGNYELYEITIYE